MQRHDLRKCICEERGKRGNCEPTTCYEYNTTLPRSGCAGAHPSLTTFALAVFTACEPPKGIAMCGISMSKSELEFAHASGPASARRNRKLSRAENIAKPVSIELFGVYIAMSALSSKTGQAQNDRSSGASHSLKILLPFPSFVRDQGTFITKARSV